MLVLFCLFVFIFLLLRSLLLLAGWAGALRLVEVWQCLKGGEICALVSLWKRGAVSRCQWGYCGCFSFFALLIFSSVICGNFFFNTCHLHYQCLEFQCTWVTDSARIPLKIVFGKHNINVEELLKTQIVLNFSRTPKPRIVNYTCASVRSNITIILLYIMIVVVQLRTFDWQHLEKIILNNIISRDLSKRCGWKGFKNQRQNLIQFWELNITR